MSLINHEELKKQLASGEITSLDDITAEFKNILKEVIQTATQEELTSHLGYDKHQESTSSNSRNGYNEKTINSKYGQFDVSIPRDRESSFEPQLVKKREIYLDGTEDLILSLYTKGMSVRDIQLHLDDLYGYELSTQTISNITEKVIEKANVPQGHFLPTVRAMAVKTLRPHLSNNLYGCHSFKNKSGSSSKKYSMLYNARHHIRR
jgi:transposase-like protein